MDETSIQESSRELASEPMCEGAMESEDHSDGASEGLCGRIKSR